MIFQEQRLNKNLYRQNNSKKVCHQRDLTKRCAVWEIKMILEGGSEKKKWWEKQNETKTKKTDEQVCMKQ